MGGQGSGGNGKNALITVDMDAALDLLMRGEKESTVAEELGISVPTLKNRIKKIQESQGVLLQYRSLQSLQLTELQARILEAITPAKIEHAPLKDLVLAFKVLKEKELNIEGKPSEIKGLIAHLVYIEKQEAAAKSGVYVSSSIEEAEYSDIFADENESENGKVSDLSLLDDQVL